MQEGGYSVFAFNGRDYILCSTSFPTISSLFKVADLFEDGRKRIEVQKVREYYNGRGESHSSSRVISPEELEHLVLEEKSSG